MPRLVILLCCLFSLCGFAQRRAVVRDADGEMVRFFPKMGPGGSINYFTASDEEYLKQYTTWADLAERSAQSKRPISLIINMDSATQRSDWASLRKVKNVQMMVLALPNTLPAGTLDSLLDALANWTTLRHISLSSPRIDLTKPQPSLPKLTEQRTRQLTSVESASFFGPGNELTMSIWLLKQCPALKKLTINGVNAPDKPFRLPAELSQLTQLQTLQLSNAGGVANLDTAFAGLTQLTSLYMTNTGSGPKLTKALNQLPKLRRLELRFGFTDTELGGFRLANLRALDTLELHFIAGTNFPVDSVLVGVSSLKSVILENALLPTLDWMADNPDLRVLNLTGCRFPPSHRPLAKLTQLETISIDQSDSLGVFPDQFTTLPNLRELSIPDAQLSSLPPGIGAMTSLTALNLYHNKLASLPAELGNLRALKTLNLGNNQLVSLPPSVLQLTLLESLALYDNQLVSLPDGIGQLARLQHLFLSSNQLIMLPAQLARCRNLLSLTLDNNPLTALPETLGKLDSLQTLSLRDTRLGALPASIGQLTNLRNLISSGGHLSVLPVELGNCQNLDRLVLTDSSLAVLPGSLSALKKLTVLSLTLPQLRALPDGLTSLTSLEELTLQMPQLLVLPTELSRLTSLRELTVRSRKLLGLPNSLGRLTKLTKLTVDGEAAPDASQPFGAMEFLPDSIGFCSALTDVRIENQQAFDGTDAIRKTARLPKLNRLSMLHCGIDQLADIDWKTVLFSSLYLDENNLRTLPEALLEAPNLQSVNLVGNTRLPASLNQIFMNKETLRKAMAATGR
ncbi:leucine-rich repeat domain-containing protein [Fibrella aquatilis]|uniref:Leucine-rich repeat domain-containing protein n=1 Tax=Fibrella aquatilis TaxID=2817059 RepID=A0A939JZQ2_9BACT|nr:leucine-rich repeat domain-containing protein [Fibrella aquatilis]MBO0931181.1 leucine-rich repeat domain-containing protein [Fibrella aquatilis]